MITILSDYSDVEKEFDRLEQLPDFKTHLALDAVLATGFKATQAEVHVITGSLKLSGKKSSEVHETTHVWEGEIRYGGPSGGINNPVNYAIYEKARDAEHDFMKSLPGLHLAYVEAIKKGLAG
jgi:hypothetical protein